jgi:hypothetical protein
MAASSSTSAAITLMPVSKKLTCGYFIIWKAQVLAVLHGAQLTEFLDGSNPAPAEKLMLMIQKEKAEEVPNPAFASWKACAGATISKLLAHICLVRLSSHRIVIGCHCMEAHRDFSSQSRTRVINTQMALATTLKGSSMASEYLSKMKMLTDDEDLCSYILAGPDYEYYSLVSIIAAWIEPITMGELYSQLLSFEAMLKL